jgi:hypothetical protein
MATTFHARELDAGNCRQNVTATDGVITDQWLEARSGYYTGDGNPEFIGQPVAILRGKGFRKVRGPVSFASGAGRWQAADPDEWMYNRAMQELAAQDA